MVVIRLSRWGSKKDLFYRIVIADNRMPRDGRFIERVGYYNPVARGHSMRLQVKRDRIAYWLSQGAATSLRVKHLIKQLEKSPEKTQKGGPRKGELKRAQAEQSSKAQKTKMAEELKAKEKEAT